MNDDEMNVEPESIAEPVTEAEPPAPSTAKLVLKRNGAETSEVFEVRDGSIIGRFDPEVGPIDVDLGQLPEGVYISRKHARVSCEDGVWELKDLGSSNGTFVLRGDVEPAFDKVEETELEEGTEFALGNVRFVFRLG